MLSESQLAPAASGEQLPVGVTTLTGLARGRCEHWRARPSRRLSVRCRSRGGPEAEADPTLKKAHHTAAATERVRAPVPAGRQLPSRTGHASSSFRAPEVQKGGIRKSRSEFPCAIFSRSAGLIGAFLRKVVPSRLSAIG